MSFMSTSASTTTNSEHQEGTSATSTEMTMAITEDLDLDRLTVADIDALQSLQLNYFINVLYEAAVAGDGDDKNEEEEEDEGIGGGGGGGGGGSGQKAVEIKSYDETGREVVHRVVLRPVHRSTTIASADASKHHLYQNRPRPRVTIREQGGGDNPTATTSSSSSSRSPDEMMETMSFANRRNLWERRSLGRGYKFRGAGQAGQGAAAAGAALCLIWWG
ncbi:hypothetical protein TYRP_009580 [Tyrophagus putrescentiae]|nr:hypothetical protein TYRP_009580 [Tyrophagus putrescentiae]